MAEAAPQAVGTKRRTTWRLAFLAPLGLILTLAVAAAAEPAGIPLHEAPQPLPPLDFADGDGKALTLDDFKGKVVVLNIWATWCAPCRKEMPTLDRLQARLGGPDFEVVALSIDRAGMDAVRAFYTEVGVEHLATYMDESGNAARELEVWGLPATILVGPDGQELGRHVGPAEWDTPEMVAFFEEVVAAQRGDG